MSEIDEIKSKLDIVEVIREYVPVKAAGASFQALCPFHHEKTPSFTISPDKQVWHCFGCGRGGDVFSFVMEKENLSFVETLRLLAKKAGVTLKGYDRQEYSERNRLLDIMELAGKYYAHILGTSSGDAFRAYLEKRGLTPETIQDWHIGCSPDSWDNLYKFLKARPLEGKKFTDEEIFGAGLSLKKQSGAGYLDRFRDRIMFPIWDATGSLIAFTARVNPAKEKTEKMGKYVNSPQTKVYDKSRVLFGLNKAKAAIREADLAIVVEGQMDVIACHQHGFRNVVASSGTALTDIQVGLIKRFTNNVALLFDMDQAGQLAADRGIREVLAQEMNLKVITLAAGKDPAEALSSNPEDFRQAVVAAKPMLEYYFTKITAGLDLDNFDNKRLVRDKMFAMIDIVANQTEQGFWLKKTSEDLGFFEQDMREEFEKWREKRRRKEGVIKDGGRQPGVSGEKQLQPEISREDKLSERLIALLIRFPEHINYASSNLEPEDLISQALAGFYRNVIIYYNKADSFDYQGFRAHLEDSAEALKLLDKLALLGERDFYDFQTESAKAELLNIIAEMKTVARQARKLRLQRAIARAEKEGNDEEVSRLMNELNNLTAG